MHDYQRIVDDIQALLVAEGDIPKESFYTLCRQYLEALQEINARLRECDTLLRKGHWAEAIHNSKTEPDLLEAAIILDFPERVQWADFMVQHGLPGPPALLVEAAADLNAAYASSKPLEEWMRFHRLSALARRPLQTRIEILRKIAQLDPQNVIWEQDVRTFEKHRLNQLASEAEQAHRSGDCPTLAALEEEAKSPDWREKPPPRLLQQIVQAHTQLRINLARQELEKLEEGLTEAFSSFDVIKGRAIRSHWNAKAVIGITCSDDPLLERVAPAMQWLEQQDRKDEGQAEYHEALAGLEQALDKGSIREELDRFYHVLTRHETGIPPQLENRLAERLRYLDEQQRRKYIFIVTIVVFFVLVFVGATGAGIYYHFRHQTLVAHITAVSSLIQDRKYSEADKYLQNLASSESSYYQSPQIQQIAHDLEAKRNDEDQRIMLRADFIKKAQNFIDQPIWESYPVALAALDEALKHSVTEVEKATLKELHLRIDEVRQKMQKDIDDAFIKDWNDLQADLESIKDGDKASITNAIQKIDVLMQRPLVSDELKSPLRNMRDRLIVMNTTIERNNMERTAVDQITQAVGNQDAFCRALQRYCSQFPESLKKSHFERVLQEDVALWKSFSQWNEFISKLADRDLSLLEPADAAALVKEFAEQKAQNVQVAPPTEFERMTAFLEAISRRVDNNGNKIQFQLLEPLNNPTVAKLMMIQSNNGKRYYFQREPIEAPNVWILSYLIGFDLTTSKQSIQIPTTDVVYPRNMTKPINWNSPQAIFSTFAKDQLTALGPGNWESTFCKLLDRLHQDSNMEPILKVQLIQRFLEVACQGSQALNIVLQPAAELLKNITIDPGANWLDPKDVDGQKARESTEAVLQRIGSFADAYKKANEHLALLKKPKLGPAYAWIAWLNQEPDGSWRFMTNINISNPVSGDLFVLCRPREGQPAQMTRIGLIKNGQLGLSSAPQDSLREGRPVYCQIPAKESSKGR
jgi:hypothetical protein